MGDLFGVAVSPFELEEWQAATNIRPDTCMIFEHWAKQRTLAEHVKKAASLGHRHMAVTWEPWSPVPLGAKPEVQGLMQPEWSADSILAGRHDGYIDNFARALRDCELTIYLRWGHEMNGQWYPWHVDPEGFVEAWKYIRQRMRTKIGAWNVKMVWAPNPDLWRTSPADWLQRLVPYWPGAAAVDYVGFTMIEFGDDRHYPVAKFAERFDLARKIFCKQILAFEVNVARERALEWLDDLAVYCGGGSRPLPLVVLSQGASRAQAVTKTGDLSWSAVSDPEARDALRQVVEALHEN